MISYFNDKGLIGKCPLVILYSTYVWDKGKLAYFSSFYIQEVNYSVTVVLLHTTESKTHSEPKK